MLGRPIELVGSDSFENGKCGVKDAQIDVVAEVNPDADEKGEERNGEWRVEVV